MKIAIVGAGFSGAVVAFRLAQAGSYAVDVFDTRSHVAGNCHTKRDEETGIMVHTYGPHIFNTNNERAWKFINEFDRFMPFVNRVKAHARGRVFPLPVNLLTINLLFGKQFSPAEAKTFIQSIAETDITDPVSFEQQALRFVGRDIYETFLQGYTLKQWGRSPTELPANILKRLPVRFNYDDNYYNTTHQGIPEHGYSYIIEKLLDHSAIKLHLNTAFTRDMASDYDHVFYTGPIDYWFGCVEGRLEYRTLDFKEIRAVGDFQGNAVINYCDADVPWTRITEHKHFAPWESHEKTIAFREYSRECGEADIPYYPLRLAKEKTLLARYVALANTEKCITFLGRLGTYRYLDMDATIAEALDVADRFLSLHSTIEAMPVFIKDPLA